jgi:polar amino acid transport system substrate-binding protein
MLFDRSDMRRLAVVIGSTVLAAGLGAWGAAATTGPSTSARLDTRSATLPLLPAEIRARGRLNVAVKCDSPPFGSVVKGRHVGVDVEIAQQLALLAFGNKSRVNFTCVTTPQRESALTSGTVDLVIATFSYTPDRDTRIDFSRAYYKATGRLLVKRGSAVQSLADIRGARVATTTGSIYDRWLEKCFPTTKRVLSDKFTGAVALWRSKQADALMWDDPALVDIASRDRTAVILKDTFLPSPYGIGIQQGNTQLKRWVDTRLELLRLKDAFVKILSRNFPLHLYASFRKHVLGPKNTFGYAKRSIEECP